MITDLAGFGKATVLPPFPELRLCNQPQQETRPVNRFAEDPTEYLSLGQSSQAAFAAGSVDGSRRRDRGEFVLLFDGTLSRDDLDYLDEILAAFGLGGALVAGVDPAEFDPAEGANVAVADDLAAGAKATWSKATLASAVAEQLGFSVHRLPVPIGVARTDEFLALLERLSGGNGKSHPRAERDQLVNRLAVGGSLLTNRRVVIYGEEVDFVVGTVSLLLEAGMLPVLCAAKKPAHELRKLLEEMTPELHPEALIVQVGGLQELQAKIESLRPDVLIANREACEFAEQARIPFVCVGRCGCKCDTGDQLLHIGYRGAISMLDRLQSALRRPYFERQGASRR